MFILSRESTNDNSFTCIVPLISVGNVRRPAIPDIVPFETLDYIDKDTVKIRVWVFPESIAESKEG